MSTTTTELVSYEDPSVITERVAVAGFLAGYTGNTRTGYTTDLRIFADWCHTNQLSLLGVRRVHLELSPGGWRPKVGCAPPSPAACPR